MKKNILIVVIVIVLIAAGVGAWYFLTHSNKPIVVPASSPSEVVNPNPQSATPIGGSPFADAYKMLTKAQKDCLLQALGQKKLDGFIKNDVAIMLTITEAEYEKVSACQQ